MAAVTALGGVFLRVTDPVALAAWYEQHLGLVRGDGGLEFPAAAAPGPVLLSLFTQREDDALPAGQAVMLNLRVVGLDALLDRLAADGVQVDPRREHYDYGGFGWITDPEGNRIELWEPVDE